MGVHHKIVLKNDTEITSVKQLKEMIRIARKRILNDSSLRKFFDSITKEIDKNAELCGLIQILELHPEWIPELVDYDGFRKKVWYGYLSHPEAKPLLESYIKTYNENESSLLEGLSEAGKEQKRWERIVKLYNSRFHVPIRVNIANQCDIIMKKEAAKLEFQYVDSEGHRVIQSKEKLRNILSKGEKRAFNILQFIFEVEARKESSYDTLLCLMT